MSELIRSERASIESVARENTHLENRWETRDPRAPKVIATPDGVGPSFGKLRDDWISLVEGPGKASDLLAGVTVAAVALPLNVALSVACGLSPSVGLVSGAIGGMVAAALGGSMLQVTGPAAALGILVLGLVNRWGPVGAAAGAMVIGVIQLVLFYFRAGRFMVHVPEAVLAGFTTGVGLKLLDQQIPLLFDVPLSVDQMFSALADPTWLKEVRWTSVVSGMTVILFMLGLGKFKKLPAAIFALALVAFVSDYLGWKMLRVGDVPSALPIPAWPALPPSEWAALFVACIPLAILAAVESLLSAKAIDRMRGIDPERASSGLRPHAPNLEIFGQGMANVASGLFGGMPVSGVIVRSSVNVQAGAKSRISAMFHAVLLLLVPLHFGDWIAKLPLAALAGLLCLVGYRLVEVTTFLHVWRKHKHEGIAFLAAAAGVVSGHLSAGLLAALAICFLPAWLKGRAARMRKKPTAAPGAPTLVGLAPGIRAKITRELPTDFRSGERALFRMPEENWEAHISDSPVIHPTAFVHPNASIIGRVVLGAQVHVATEAALRADEGTPFFIGAKTNVQDGVVLHALKGKWVIVDGKKWAIYVGERVSLAHQALVHGPVFIGEDTFVGFKAVVHDSVIGRGCSIGIGAIVVGVEIPEGRFVPPGSLVDTPEKASALPPSEPHHRHFNEDVVEVNQGLSEAYRGEWMNMRIPDLESREF